MTHRFLNCFVVTVVVIFAASYAMVSDVNAQAPVPSAARDANPASKPTPHLPDGRPDLNGTWEHGRGFAFGRAQTLPDGSVCVLGCPSDATAAPAAGNAPGGRGGRGGAAAAAAAPAAPNFPKYKPEFLRKVKDLKVVERFRRVGDAIEYQATAQDPAVLVEPWTRAQALRLSDHELEESARCEDRDLEHVIDGSHHDNPR